MRNPTPSMPHGASSIVWAGPLGQSHSMTVSGRDQNGEFFGSLMVSFEPHESGPRRSVQMRNSKA